MLVSGGAGTGKTSLAAYFADAACARGERCLYFAFEESPAQVVRNMRSVGIDLDRWLESGLLRFERARPSLYGFEMHLAAMHRDIEQFAPAAVVVDPISAYVGPASARDPRDARAPGRHLQGAGRSRRCSPACPPATIEMDETERGVSSLMDTWICCATSRRTASATACSISSSRAA